MKIRTLSLGTLVAGLALQAAAMAAGASTAAAAKNTAQEIINLEKRLGDALSRVDVPLIDQLWGPDLLYISPAGKVFDKPQRMASVRASATAPAVTSSVDDVHVNVYGNTAVAIVKTTWRGSKDGKAFADAYIATHVWVKSAPGWRLVGAHVTPVAEH